jgi:hypothetical protein
VGAARHHSTSQGSLIMMERMKLECLAIRALIRADCDETIARAEYLRDAEAYAEVFDEVRRRLHKIDASPLT